MRALEDWTTLDGFPVMKLPLTLPMPWKNHTSPTTSRTKPPATHQTRMSSGSYGGYGEP